MQQVENPLASVSTWRAYTGRENDVGTACDFVAKIWCAAGGCSRSDRAFAANLALGGKERAAHRAIGKADGDLVAQSAPDLCARSHEDNGSQSALTSRETLRSHWVHADRFDAQPNREPGQR